MTTPPPPGGPYEIINAETGDVLLGFTKLGDPVRTSAGIGGVPGVGDLCVCVAES
jgi:hypothetical protein